MSKPPPPKYYRDAQLGDLKCTVTNNILKISLRGYAAHFKPRFSDSRHKLEFGDVIYGPLRQDKNVAESDLADFQEAFKSDDIIGLRKQIAITGALGGTHSRVPHNVIPLLQPEPVINAVAPQQQSGSPLIMSGSRRPNVSVQLQLNEHSTSFLRRAIDLTVDLLGACADTQLRLLPSWQNIKDALMRGLNDPQNLEIHTHACKQIYDALTSHILFADLEIPNSFRDEAAIAGLIAQLSARAAPGDKKSKEKIKQAKRRLQRLRANYRKSLIVWNVPRGATPDEIRAVLDLEKVSLVQLATDPKSGEFRGYAFATAANLDAAKSLDGQKIFFKNRMLFVNQRKISQGLKARVSGEKFLDERNESPPFRLPGEICGKIYGIVSAREGCNIGVVQQIIGPELNPQMYGFRNLVTALQSVPGLTVERRIPEGRVPAYVVFTSGVTG